MLILISIFGFNFLIGLIGNILLLIFLVPLLFLIIVLTGFNFYKSKINICNKCGSISLGLIDTCNNCGAELEVTINNLDKNPSESTIEIKAEEIK